MNALMVIEKAAKMLATCRDLDEVRTIRDKAEAISRYQRSRAAAEDGGVSAAIIARRAERRLGELVADLPKAPGARAKGVGKRGGSAPPRYEETPTLTLADRGISKDDSKRWQKMARIPAAKFEAEMMAARAQRTPPTVAGLLRLVPRRDPEEPRLRPFDQEEACRKLEEYVTARIEEWRAADGGAPGAADYQPLADALDRCSARLEQLARAARAVGA